MKSPTSLILTIAIFLSACTQQSKHSSDLKYYDVSEGFGNKHNLKLSELVNEIEIVQFENSGDAYFLNPRSYSIGEKYIMIADDGEDRIILFDRSGNFIRHIGQKGKGPGEFNNPWQTVMDSLEEYIYVADGIMQKIIKYSVLGEFVEEINTDTLFPGRMMKDIRFINDQDFIVLAQRPSKPVVGFANLLLFDRDLYLKKRIFPRNREESVLRGPSIVNQGTDMMLFWEAFHDTLYHLTPGGEPMASYIVTCSKNGFTQEYAVGIREPGRPIPKPPENRIYSVNEFGQHIFVDGFRGDDYFRVFIDKRTDDIYELSNVTACDTSGNFSIGTIENDLFGIEPIFLDRYDPKSNCIIAWMDPSWIASSYDSNCLRNRSVKNPALRDQLLRIAEDPEASENRVLLLMKMK